MYRVNYIYILVKVFLCLLKDTTCVVRRVKISSFVSVVLFRFWLPSRQVSCFWFFDLEMPV